MVVQALGAVQTDDFSFSLQSLIHERRLRTRASLLTLDAKRCLMDCQRREFSDRIVVAVAADAPWPLVESRYLNAAELDTLYEHAGGDGWADVWKRHYFAWEYKGQCEPSVIPTVTSGTLVLDAVFRGAAGCSDPRFPFKKAAQSSISRRRPTARRQLRPCSGRHGPAPPSISLARVVRPAASPWTYRRTSLNSPRVLP